MGIPPPEGIMDPWNLTMLCPWLGKIEVARGAGDWESTIGIITDFYLFFFRASCNKALYENQSTNINQCNILYRTMAHDMYLIRSSI